MICPECKQEMQLREPGTSEQAWCGIWHDCLNTDCRHSSTLIPSEELQRFWGETVPDNTPTFADMMAAQYREEMRRDAFGLPKIDKEGLLC
jgi:hypothetical protein